MAGVVNNCKKCGFVIFDEQTRKMLCDVCEAEENGLPEGDSMLCNHANEVPVDCPCGPNCYCRTQGSCRSPANPNVRVFKIIPTERKRKKKKVKKVTKKAKKEQSYLGKFDNIDVEDDGTGD